MITGPQTRRRFLRRLASVPILPLATGGIVAATGSPMGTADTPKLDRSRLGLRFADEFDELRIDTRNTGDGGWLTCFPMFTGYQRHFAEGSAGKPVEAVHYVDRDFAPFPVEAHAVTDSVLRLSSDVIPADRRAALHYHKYWAGMINGQNRHVRQYGYFEARIRIKPGRGFWPAFWMLPASGIPHDEIDILEVMMANPRRMWFSQHWGAERRNSSEAVEVRPDAGHWNTYGVLWEADTMRWYVNDVERHRMPTYVHQPMFVVVTMQAGSAWEGGDPDQTTPWPGWIEVDWIRIHEVMA